MQRLRSVLRNDQGLTLVELMVAMAVGLIILVAAGGFLISVERASVQASSTSQNTRVASVGMREMQRMFRVASNNPVSSGQDTQYAFQYASPTVVRFFAYINLASSTIIQPTEVQFTLNASAGTIVETKWAGTATDGTNSYWTFPMATGATLSNAPTAQTTIATGVTAMSFTYLDPNGNTLTPGTAGLSAADLQNVDSVGISLTVGTTNTTSPQFTSNVTMSDTVQMPNIQIGS